MQNLDYQFQHRSIILAFQQMDERIDGLLFAIAGSWRCLINESKPAHRKRYTMAHELVHYDRHRQYSWCFMEPEGQESTWMEHQANVEAACILMPEESVVPFWEAICNRYLRDFRVGAMSWQFGVSEEAMQYRLQDLGLISRREGLR